MINYQIIKRILDLSLSLILLPIAIPLIFILSIGLWIELREFPIYFQKRGLALHSNLFTIIKLKTIKSNPQNIVNEQLHSGIMYKPALRSSILPFSSWLRRTGLDEIPQIFNVILGQMSFIGPRPLMIADLQVMKKKFSIYHLQRQQITAKPGITGMWQLFCNRDEGVKNLLALDLFYDEFKSISLDIKIFLFTIPVVLTGSNDDAIVNKPNFPIKSFFGLSKTTHFNISSAQSADSSTGNTEAYKIEIPGNWWSQSIATNSRRTKSAIIFNIESSNKIKKTGTY